jgi:uncharacterized repeat protein (TIGR03837 family)
MAAPLTWDIFCKVVDNFGDAGVCWRLARQLAREHGFHVRLWIDKPEVLSALRSGDATHAPGGIEIQPWRAEDAPEDCAEVVIEAFGAPAPASYLAAMARSARPPVWINLEYLSAETWVEGCHALPSPHPRLPLTQWFFYPGFNARTGGLLREADLLERHRDFLAADGPGKLWQTLKIAAPPTDALKLSLFAYRTDALPALLDIWAAGTTPIWCAAPEGLVSQQVRAWADAPLMAGGKAFQRGRLTLQILPFLAQTTYDLLLWACDLNFVRGEDSFVRAQWASHPFIWQIYRQDEAVHLEKLTAFLERYSENLSATATTALCDFHADWNPAGESTPAFAKSWPRLVSALPELTRHAQDWSERLSRQTDLASALADFVKSKLK